MEEKIIKNTLKIIAILIGVSLLYFIRDIIGYLLLAFILAAALRPGIDWLEKRKIPRFLSGIFIFLFALAILSLILWLILPPFILEIQSFVSLLPQYWQNFLNWLPRFREWTRTTPFGQGIENTLNQFLQKISEFIGKFVGFIFSLAGKIFNLLFVIIVAFYLAIEKNLGERIAQFLFVKSPKLKEKVSKYWRVAEDLTGRWLQGYIFLGILIAAMVYIALSIIEVRYSLILAVLAGILEIIPWFGPVFSGLIGSILAFSQGGWTMALWTVLAFFIIQQLENYLIIPFVMKNRVDLNPLLTIIVLFVGGKFGGIPGMILAVPLSATLLSLFREEIK